MQVENISIVLSAVSIVRGGIVSAHGPKQLRTKLSYGALFLVLGICTIFAAREKLNEEMRARIRVLGIDSPEELSNGKFRAIVRFANLGKEHADLKVRDLIEIVDPEDQVSSKSREDALFEKLGNATSVDMPDLPGDSASAGFNMYPDVPASRVSCFEKARCWLYVVGQITYTGAATHEARVTDFCSILKPEYDFTVDCQSHFAEDHTQ